MTSRNAPKIDNVSHTNKNSFVSQTTHTRPTTAQHIFSLVILTMSAVFGLTASAQEQLDTPTPKPIYLIYDSSNSMWGALSDGTRKYEAARSAVHQFLTQQDQATTAQPLALRVYGARSKDDCRDSHLVAPMAADNAATIAKTIDKIRPTGQTPIFYSLVQARRDLAGNSASILIVTDGLESCDRDPCELLQRWQDEQLDINVHIVGLGLSRHEVAAMQCFADITGNEVLHAQNTDELIAGLGQAHAQITGHEFGFSIQEPPGELGEIQTPGQGTLTRVDANNQKTGEPIQVVSNRRYTPEPGDYQLTAGVRTASGEVFEQSTQKISIQGSTKIVVPAKIPGQLSVSLQEANKVFNTTLNLTNEAGVSFKVRSRDTVWLMPGTYQLRAELNQFNNVSETIEIKAGQRLTKLIELNKTVHTYVHAYSATKDIRIRRNVDLIQEQNKVATIHTHNGARMPPGEYIARVPDRFFPYETPVTITHADPQTIDVKVPMGYLTVAYPDPEHSSPSKSTSTKTTKPSKRIFISHNRRTKTFRSGDVIPLMPGTYTLQGHPKAAYQAQEFSISAASEQNLVLQPIEPEATP